MHEIYGNFESRHRWNTFVQTVALILDMINYVYQVDR
jgi:hypothetical protein